MCFHILLPCYGNSLSQGLGIVWISVSRKVCEKHLTLECSIFSYFFPTIRNHVPHVLWKILLTWRLTKKFYLRSYFHSNVYVKLFNKELNLFCCWTQSKICISNPFAFVNVCTDSLSTFCLFSCFRSKSGCCFWLRIFD